MNEYRLSKMLDSMGLSEPNYKKLKDEFLKQNRIIEDLDNVIRIRNNYISTLEKPKRAQVKQTMKQVYGGRS